MNAVKPYWKAVIAALIAVAIVLVQTVQAQGSDGAWTTEDTLVTILAVLGAVAVYFKGNEDPEAEHQDESVRPPAA